MITKPELSTTLSQKLNTMLAIAEAFSMRPAEDRYNAEFVEIKDRLNNRIWDEQGELQRYVLSFRDIAPYSYTWDHLCYELPYGSHELVSKKKKLVKLAASLRKEDSPWAEVVDNLVAYYSEDYLTVVTRFLATKATNQMGRKPKAESDRVTPIRTLDNTGTCPICCNNQKLNGGTMVSHGYRVHWNSHQGNCFGVGHLPYEVSPNGCEAYVKVLEQSLVEREEALPIIPTEFRVEIRKGVFEILSEENPLSSWGGYTYAGQVESRKYRLEQEIRFLKNDIRIMNDRIAQWTPKPLPGEKGK